MRRAAVVLLVGTLAACGGDSAGPAGPTIAAELVGTWEASPACFPACGLTFVNVASATDTLNFTATPFGYTSRFTLASNGTFTFDAGVPTVSAINGRMRMEGASTLVVEPSAGADEERVTYSLSGGFLSLLWEDTYSFNLDGAGAAETVRVRGRFEKR